MSGAGKPKPRRYEERVGRVAVRKWRNGKARGNYHRVLRLVV